MAKPFKIIKMPEVIYVITISAVFNLLFIISPMGVFSPIGYQNSKSMSTNWVKFNP